MGDHNGGGGRVGARAGARRGNGAGRGRVAAGRASLSADNVLALNYADRLNDARNPGRQRVLETQDTVGGSNAAADARNWVAGFRAGFSGIGEGRVLRVNGRAGRLGMVTGQREGGSARARARGETGVPATRNRLSR